MHDTFGLTYSLAEFTYNSTWLALFTSIDSESIVINFDAFINHSFPLYTHS